MRTSSVTAAAVTAILWTALPVFAQTTRTEQTEQAKAQRAANVTPPVREAGDQIITTLEHSTTALGRTIRTTSCRTKTAVSCAVGRSEETAPALPAPVPVPPVDNTLLRVDVAATASAHPAWSVPVTAYFCGRHGGWTLVGLERAGSRRTAAAARVTSP